MRPLFALVGLLAAAAAAQAGSDDSHRHGVAGVDADGDGFVTRDEAQAHPWLAGKFDSVDTNKDGQLTRDEMMAARKEGYERMREHAAERFKTADANGDGGIDLAEAQTGMPKLADKFSTVDTNNDGQVTSEELRALHHH